MLQNGVQRNEDDRPADPQNGGGWAGAGAVLGSMAALVCGSAALPMYPAETLPPPDRTTAKEEPTAQELLRGFTVLRRTDPCWAFVGRVYSEQNDLIGSCVLISPTIALTVAHVVYADWQTIRTPLTAHFGETRVAVREVIPCPALTIRPPTQFAGAHVLGDLAIIHLDAPVQTETLPVMPDEPCPVHTREPLRLVGHSYDIMKATADDALYSSGITRDEPESIPVYPFFANPSFGDSGGGVFDETGALVGIMYRFVLTPSGEVMEFSVVNIGHYRAWIDSTVRRLLDS